MALVIGGLQYCLIRAFPSAARRQEQLDSFYGSDEWRRNHRDAVMALIKSHHTVLTPLNQTIIQALVAAMPPDPVDAH